MGSVIRGMARVYTQTPFLSLTHTLAIHPLWPVYFAQSPETDVARCHSRKINKNVHLSLSRSAAAIDTLHIHMA